MPNTKNNNKTPNKKKIIEIFNELYMLHMVLENHYEARAYKNIIDVLNRYPGEIKSADQLKGIPGIGGRTLMKIDEILKTGKLQLLEDMKKDKKILARLELQRVLGIGPKLAKKLVEEKGIMSVKELKKAYEKGKVSLTSMQIIGVKYYNKLTERIPRKEIEKYHKKLEKVLRKKYPEMEVIIAGSYRRGKPTSGDIDVIISTPKIKTEKELRKTDIFDEIVKYLVKEGIVIEIVSQGEDHIMGITDTKRQIDLKMSPYNLISFFLLYFGSGEHFSRHIRQKAKEKGYRLSEWGLYNRSGKIIMNKAENEKEIFEKIGEKYVKPQNR